MVYYGTSRLLQIKTAKINSVQNLYLKGRLRGCGSINMLIVSTVTAVPTPNLGLINNEIRVETES